MPKAKTIWTKFSEGALKALYADTCSLCEMPSDKALCSACLAEMKPSQVLRLPSDGPLDTLYPLFDYEGRASQAIRRLKYSKRTALAGPMAQLMRDFLGERIDLTGKRFVPVPIHFSRLSSRGFNQAELLASAMPRVTADLERVRRTRSQAGMSLEARRANLSGAFTVTSNVRGLDVMLVDDVYTSGQTAMECAGVLKEAGARSVGILVFASRNPKMLIDGTS